MDNYIEMKLKKTNEIVRVYNISTPLNTNKVIATIFIKSLYKATGNGWQTVSIGKLVPIDIPCNPDELQSNTHLHKLRKEAGARLDVRIEGFYCIDGKCFELKEDAIRHNIKILLEEESLSKDVKNNLGF